MRRVALALVEGVGNVDGTRESRLAGISTDSGPVGEMCSRVLYLCERSSRETSVVHAQDQIRATSLTLREPLRVVVAGRVSMGKSTLVNALVGQVIAPTGDAETTKAITVFSGADHEEVTLVLRSGEIVSSALTLDGRLPQQYSVPVERIQEVDVRLPGTPLLRTITLIDSPGLQSVTDTASERSRESFFSADSRAAYSDADALIMVMRAGGMSDDQEALEAFQRLTRGADSLSLNAIGVLSRADECGDPVDPLGAAARIADRLSRSSGLHHHLAVVVPVAARLAETVNSGSFTEMHLDALRRLKAVHGKDPDLTADLDAFHELADQVIPELSAWLVDRLGLVGIRAVLDSLATPGSNLSSISEELVQLSGVERLSNLVEELFVPRADVLKADHALTGLTRLSYQVEADLGRLIRDEVEAIRALPEFHSLRELWALHAGTELLETGLTRPVPEWVMTELAAVARTSEIHARLGMPVDTSLSELHQEALRRAARSHQFALSPTTTAAQKRVAEILRTSYSNLAQVLQQQQLHKPAGI
jgi:energy-coupling factor transporter ATP-binding protein EcfA2